MPRQYKACRSLVHGSKPPVSFLDELVDWARFAPETIFLPNAKFDIYSSVVKQLGPYGVGAHRKAVMLEVLRVLAGRESNWRWTMGLDKGLKDYAQATLGATDDATFITGMKSNHKFAIEYTARLLRVTIRHHGPIVHHHIHGELQRAAVNEFRGYLERIGDFPTPPRGLSYA